MLERSFSTQAGSAEIPAEVPPTALAGRRLVFFTLVALSIAGLLSLLAVALAAGGFGVVDAVLLLLFAATLPWTVIGFWNATIGFLVMRLARDPVAVVTPVAARVRGDEPITASTAILLCTRNEPPDRVVHHLAPLLEGLAARGTAERFHLYILSDTDDPAIAVSEEVRFANLAAAFERRLAVTYRRRTANTGFKAGNIHDFCDRWGAQHDFALVLDADSVMTANAVLRLIRVMQADPRLGILQSLVVGMPSGSAFARLFQFGMRLGMRSYTIGSAWWQGDCGPYWGHNALIRLAPFITHCPLPGGHLLSHDQLEAVLMRRAGFEVRVLPEEGESFEQNPPTLLEFIRRDLRWCQGNMQYGRCVVMPGLHPVSRYQLAFAMLMFLGSPAWIGLLIVGSAAAASAGPGEFMRADAGLALFAIVLVMWFAPKVATVIDVLTRPDLRRAFGGAARFLASVAAETIFFVLLSPIMWFGHSVFLIGLLFRRSIGWGTQARDHQALPFWVAARALWPHSLLGLASIALLAATVPQAIPYALFIAGGLLLSIPLAVLTAAPAVGRALTTLGIGRLPEETAPPPELAALARPVIEPAAAELAPQPAA
jgi:membrane glycosyltransferase